MRSLYPALLSILLLACGGKAYTPKPHAYPRVYYPQRAYTGFDTNAPFRFLYPEYARVNRYRDNDSSSHPFWYNIDYLPFNATLHLSYHNFSDRSEFDKLFDDTRRLVYKHDIKAEEIEEIEMQNPRNNSTGIIYELKGNTATNLNFYISDGKKHFLRGALYFNDRTEIDSIQPVFDFLKEDVLKMLESLSWKQ
jgi:gliding motility-associated lipoprotein GldD